MDGLQRVRHRRSSWRSASPRALSGSCSEATTSTNTPTHRFRIPTTTTRRTPRPRPRRPGDLRPPPPPPRPRRDHPSAPAPPRPAPPSRALSMHERVGVSSQVPTLTPPWRRRSIASARSRTRFATVVRSSQRAGIDVSPSNAPDIAPVIDAIVSASPPRRTARVTASGNEWGWDKNTRSQPAPSRRQEGPCRSAPAISPASPRCASWNGALELGSKRRVRHVEPHRRHELHRVERRSDRMTQRRCHRHRLHDRARHGARMVMGHPSTTPRHVGDISRDRPLPTARSAQPRIAAPILARPCRTPSADHRAPAWIERDDSAVLELYPRSGAATSLRSTERPGSRPRRSRPLRSSDSASATISAVSSVPARSTMR